MLKQIKTLTKVQLLNLWGINSLVHTKDKQQKKRLALLLSAWALIGAILLFYSYSLASACLVLGLENYIPLFLPALTSVIIFLFSVFYAGGLIFQTKTYDMLISLPVTPSAIVISRFLTMYAGNLILSVLFLLPGLLLYAGSAASGPLYYLLALLGMFLLPLLPMTLACAAGALILAVSSRMKHKSLFSSGLSLIFIAAVLVLNGRLSMMDDELNNDLLARLSDLMAQRIQSLWPPASLLARGLTEENLFSFLLFTGLSAGIFLLFVYLVQLRFSAVCSALNAHGSSRNYVMQELKQASPVRALYAKELRHYFASSIYVTNTIAGYLMMTVAAAALYFTGAERFEEMIGMPGLTGSAAPILFASVSCITSVTSCSVSIEGKQWWITQSLPIQTRDLCSSKILLQLTAAAPFYLTAELFLFPALRPDPQDSLLLLFLPAAYILYSAVLGLAVNLKMPVFDWTSETTAVKQSASTILTMLLSFISFGIPAFLTVTAASGLMPFDPRPLQWAAFAVIVILTYLLYRQILRADLRTIH